MAGGRRPIVQAPAVQFVPWKPDRCEEPGCDEPHPNYSRDGMAGPWRCEAHDAVATRRPTDHLAPAAMPKRQDSLL